MHARASFLALTIALAALLSVSPGAAHAQSISLYQPCVIGGAPNQCPSETTCTPTGPNAITGLCTPDSYAGSEPTQPSSACTVGVSNECQDSKHGFPANYTCVPTGVTGNGMCLPQQNGGTASGYPGDTCTKDSDCQLPFTCNRTSVVAVSGTCGQPPANNTPTNPEGQPTNPNAGSNVTLINPLGPNATLSTFITDVLSLVVKIGSVVVILMLVYVGFLFVTAQGNETQLEHAKSALIWTVVGALVLLGAQAIALGIQATVSALSTS